MRTLRRPSICQFPLRDFAAQVLILAFLAAGAWSAPAAATPRPPNIVIIFADDMGYGDVGVFGAKGYKTPHLDRLASEGRIFRNFHVPQPVCSASRAGLMTGCYPSRVGIQGALGPRARIGINSGEMTLAELVKQRGYATAIIGKWHLGDAPQFLPLRHGFDEYFGLPYSNDMWPWRPVAGGKQERRPDVPELRLFENDKVAIPQVTEADQDQLTTRYTEHAVDFIRRHKKHPFFLYLAHNLPHVPLHVSAKFRGKTARGLYGDVIEEIDWSVGQVVKALKKNGLEKNTLVIFTSDNGPWLCYGDHAGSAGPLREGKGTCWEGGTREPCIMRWPGRIPAGTESWDMLMTIDLLPTIARLVDAPLPAHKIDGLDVWPLISGERGAVNPHDAYYFYYEANQLQAVVSGDGRWKLQLPHTYRTLNGRPGGTGGLPAKYDQRKIEAAELYDLTTDVSEAKDVAAGHPEVVEKLQKLAAAARQDLGDSLTGQTGAGVREPGRLPREVASPKK